MSSSAAKLSSGKVAEHSVHLKRPIVSFFSLVANSKSLTGLLLRPVLALVDQFMCAFYFVARINKAIINKLMSNDINAVTFKYLCFQFVLFP